MGQISRERVGMGVEGVSTGALEKKENLG